MAPKRPLADEDGTTPATAGAANHAVLPPEGTQFQDGAVVTVRMRDFVTYNDVEVKPGPNLNVVIGPNGTGKSTIVCAICLGLAGSTSVLGRQKKIGDFVRSGAEQAMIEVELFRTGRPNMLVRREFTKDSKSTWSINGKKCTEIKVKEAVRELGVQIDNLCQFLPQDKVPEFARMDPISLLEETEKAAGGQEMLQQHKELISLSEEEVKLRHAKEQEELHLQKLQSQNALLEPDIQRHKERQRQRRTIVALNMKRPWVEYESVRQEYIRAKDRRTELTAQIAAEREKAGPLQREVDELEEQATALERTRKEAQAQVNKVNTDQQKQLVAFEKLVEEAEDVTANLEQARQDKKKNTQALQKQTKQLAQLEAEKEKAVQSTAPLEYELQQVSERMKEVSQRITSTHREARKLQSEMQPIENRIRDAQKELHQLESIADQRLQDLRSRRKDSWQAIQWLRENQDKFEKPIIEPISLVLDIKDPADAKYIEASVSANNLDAFVAQTPKDQELFLRLVRDDQRLRINVVCDPCPTRAVAQYRPKVPLDDLRGYGFKRHVLDMFDAPDAVRRVLCQFHHVHEVPVGDARVTKHAAELASKGVVSYFDPEYKVTNKHSRYGNKELVCNQVPIRNPRLLTSTINTAKRDEVAGVLRGLKRDYDQFTDRAKQIKAEMEADKQEEGKLRHRSDELKKLIANGINLDARISRTKDSIKRAEAVIKQAERKEAQCVAELRRQQLGRAQQLLKVYNAAKALEDLCDKVTIATLHSLEVRCKLDVKRRGLEHGQQLLRELTTEKATVEQQTRRLRDEARAHLEAAHRATNTPKGEELSMELQNTFSSLPDDLEGIDRMLAEEEARLQCHAEVSADVIKEYEEREKEIQRRLIELEDHKKVYEEQLRKMNEIKEQWLPTLESLIEKIGKSYSEFFSRLNCVGTVSLRKHETSYAQFGIEIRVKFREKEELQLLTSYTQSGGERSVSTMLYLMALQALTKCPFRVVDEINQGMDPFNERRVFSQVVHCSSNSDTSQYFLVTPKLLPNLEYNDKLRVLCVFNGPMMLSYKEWDMAKFLAARERNKHKRARQSDA